MRDFIQQNFQDPILLNQDSQTEKDLTPEGKSESILKSNFELEIEKEIKFLMRKLLVKLISAKFELHASDCKKLATYKKENSLKGVEAFFIHKHLRKLRSMDDKISKLGLSEH